MRNALLGLAALSVAATAMPSVASAQSYGYQDHGRYERDYRDGRHDNGYRGDRRDNRRYANYYDRSGRYSGPSWRGRDGRNYCTRSDGTTGLLIGGVAGALVGRTIDTRGDRTTGTLLGAVAGALLGKAIEKDGNNNGRRCR